MCMFLKSLFVLLYFFCWPLCCLLFFDIYGFWYPFGIYNLFFPLVLEVLGLYLIHLWKWLPFTSPCCSSFDFLCCVFVCFVCLCSVSCSQSCLYPWIVHSGLLFRFSLTFVGKSNNLNWHLGSFHGLLCLDNVKYTVQYVYNIQTYSITICISLVTVGCL